MSGGSQSRASSRFWALLPRGLAIALLSCVSLTLAFAQVHGVPPSVTSIQFHVPPFLPNIMPSVTSLGPSGYAYRAGPIPSRYGVYPNRSIYNSGRRNGRGYYGYGASYSVPYYVPIYDTSAGYDSGGGGPYLYSGPPAEQTLHIVVDLPPAKPYAAAVSDDELAAPNAATLVSDTDARSIDATVLVFRDGHQQEVSNYAIMGQTVYVFDERRQKIALGDLDVPATVKANDDRGVEFQLPQANPS